MDNASTGSNTHTPVAYDIIGDIHGQAGKLDALLGRLGYRKNGAWRHPERQAIFVGDFIDGRGTEQVRTVQTVRDMVDAGSALAVMGNHELNAIAWHTDDPKCPGEYLRRRHSKVVRRQESRAARALPRRGREPPGAPRRDHRVVSCAPAVA